MTYYYHIDKAKAAIISGPFAVNSTYIKKLTNCGNPDRLPDLGIYGLVPAVFAKVGITQKQGEPVCSADKVEVPAVEKSADELAELGVELVGRMEEAVRQYIESKGDPTGKSGRIHWTAAPMVWDKAKGGNPKNKAIKTWIEKVWGLYYQRLAELSKGGKWDDKYLDFSLCGPCPYSLLEAMLEGE